MASNLVGRFFPINNNTSPSVYEAIRQNDAGTDSSDVEERAGLALDEENLRHPFQDYELDDVLEQTSDAQSARSSSWGARRENTNISGIHSHKKRRKRSLDRSAFVHKHSGFVDPDEGDDEVPLSLLVEGPSEEERRRLQHPTSPLGTGDDGRATPLPSVQDMAPRPNFFGFQQRRGLGLPTGIIPGRQQGGLNLADRKAKAMWRWANVENLDNYLKDVYVYFLGNGIWSIILSRALNLLTLAFVVGFTSFLTSCINYRNVPQSKSMSQVIVPRCVSKMSASSTFFLWLFTLFWIGKLFQYVLDIRRLMHMHDFYYYLLGISDTDIQTISWQDIVSRLMSLRDANPATVGAISAKHGRFLGTQSKQRMDAHDIANRLMRKENYLIALFNKDILDLTLPLPFLRNRQLFSRTLEWNLNLCIIDYVFNEQGQVRSLFLKDTHRKALSEGLRRRFLFAGIMNIFIAPFIVTYFLMHYFFRYFNEYQKNPSRIGARQYTPLAEWKFREFNELWHLFQRRINMSYPFATRYIDQFPNDKVVQLARFVAFVTSALGSVLALASLVDPELFLGFEITPDRTVLFYLGVLTTVWAVAWAVVPDENLVYDPEFALNELTQFTHYRPAHWQGRLHSDEIRKEFALLYQLKVVIFLEEILSMIFTPFVLWFSLPKCSDRLIDFFREFTVHVDGLGYVCSFAVFDFKKGTNLAPQENNINFTARNAVRHDLRDDYFSTKDGKMLASYFGFLDHYGPNPRHDVPYLHEPGRRRFQPPPFSGMDSPTMHGVMGTDIVSSRAGIWDYPRQRSGPRASQAPTIPRTPKSGFSVTPGAGSNSPVASILLDPHHQPSVSGFRSISRRTGQSLYRSPRVTQTTGDTTNDKVEAGTSNDIPGLQSEPSNIATTSSGAVAADDDHLDESWRLNFAGGVDDADDPEDEDVDAVVAGGGVLGLIHQFQKVSNESRGGI